MTQVGRVSAGTLDEREMAYWKGWSIHIKTNLTREKVIQLIVWTNTELAMCNLKNVTSMTKVFTFVEELEIAQMLRSMVVQREQHHKTLSVEGKSYYDV